MVLLQTSTSHLSVIPISVSAGARPHVLLVQVPHLDGPLASMISLIRKGPISNAVLALAAVADSAYGVGDAQPFYVPLVRLQAAAWKPWTAQI